MRWGISGGKYVGMAVELVNTITIEKIWIF